ncbi:MAG TPA: hypothetical protein VJJ79_03070 [Candidatus Nanoarchaeia archaeon]|nr:hypothetical protein [Candidatus Nanoarchaeia archaeon]
MTAYNGYLRTGTDGQLTVDLASLFKFGGVTSVMHRDPQKRLVQNLKNLQDRLVLDDIPVEDSPPHKITSGIAAYRQIPEKATGSDGKNCTLLECVYGESTSFGSLMGRHIAISSETSSTPRLPHSVRLNDYHDHLREVLHMALVWHILNKFPEQYVAEINHDSKRTVGYSRAFILDRADGARETDNGKLEYVGKMLDSGLFVVLHDVSIKTDLATPEGSSKFFIALNTAFGEGHLDSHPK